MLKFVICDDDKKHNIHMQKRIEKIFEEGKMDAIVVLATTDPRAVLKYFEQNNDEPHVYILDIDFKTLFDGIDLAKQIREKDKTSYFIFVSAHQEYSMVSFKTKAFDFLVKPVYKDALELSIKRLWEDYVQSKKSKTLSVKSGSNIYVLDINNILYLEKFGQIMIVHTKNSTIRTYESLETMQRKLEDSGFFRCHKSYLINLRHIKNISIADSKIKMSNGEYCLISRNCKKELLEHVTSPI